MNDPALGLIYAQPNDKCPASVHSLLRSQSAAAGVYLKLISFQMSISDLVSQHTLAIHQIIYHTLNVIIVSLCALINFNYYHQKRRRKLSLGVGENDQYNKYVTFVTLIVAKSLAVSVHWHNGSIPCSSSRSVQFKRKNKLSPI